MIEFKNVTKHYGNTIAIRDFSLLVEQPGIYCLLGRNGAGKTTLLKMLAGHIAVTSGSVCVNGNEVSTLHMPQALYFVESTASHFHVKLEELFHIAADLQEGFDLPFAFDLAKRFGLDVKKRYQHLSFGMKAMVNTLIPLASDKYILLLDEPVLGFDPVMRKTFYDMLQEGCAHKPKTVIISTHIIDEIAKVADQLIILHKGQLLLFRDMAEIDEKAYSVVGILNIIFSAIIAPETNASLLAGVTFGEGDAISLGIGDYLYLSPILLAILVPTLHFRKLMHLGGRRIDFYRSCILTYIPMVAVVTLITCVMQVTLYPFLRSGGIQMFYMAEVFGFSARGFVITFMQMFAFFFLVSCVLHTLTLIQGYWYGWVVDVLIVTIISVFTPIAPLRVWLVRFFDLIIFHDHIAVQIVCCLVLGFVIYSASLIPIQTKRI
ncbi:MAG: ABC transporter ATP-binding protein [Clostridium sp.]|jgi:ABC-2 type transport system ATP-binding protein|nr:ABC transporter ATP-binding protein [Clostridium sp.]